MIVTSARSGCLTNHSIIQSKLTRIDIEKPLISKADIWYSNFQLSDFPACCLKHDSNSKLETFLYSLIVAAVRTMTFSAAPRAIVLS